MGQADCDRLQAEIDAELSRSSSAPMTSIGLDSGSDVLDLGSVVDLRVRTASGRDMYMTIYSIDWAVAFLESSKRRAVYWEHIDDALTVGHPMAVVWEINAGTIVRAVRRYLELAEK